MKKIISFFIFLSIFVASVSVYADSLYIQNRSTVDTVVAEVYLDGHRTPDHTTILKPGKECKQDLKDGLSVNVDLIDSTTKQSCEFAVAERVYVEDGFSSSYEPEVSLGSTCSHWGSFDQLNWVTKKGNVQDNSTINIWGPWS